MKILVTSLIAGDIIDPPAGEKKWLWRDGTKRRYTVVSLSAGKVTKKGMFVKINATCESPYDGRTFDINCQMINTKSVTKHNA